MSQELLKTRKFTVERRAYDVPGRGLVHREMVVHPGAVAILPLLGPDQVVMIRNFRYSAERDLLEIPAGTLDPGEEPAACAGRELEEETGYRADRLDYLCRFYTTPGFTNELMHVYVARGLRPTQQNLDENERIVVAPMSLDDAYAATLDGRIEDGKTIASLLAYRYHQEQHP